MLFVRNPKVWRRDFAPAACAAVLFAAGCEFGVPPEYVPKRPAIAYVSPACDTVGRASAHAVISTGGAVTFYTIAPPLPAGLSLDSLTGTIGGSPAAERTPEDYTVIATGPDGKDTAVIRLWAVASPSSGVSAPSIAYASPVIDTVGAAASHAVISTGGPVTSYALLATLPPGLSFNTVTGRISGTPTAARAPADYRVVATGPAGNDTAVLRLAVALPPSQQSSARRPSIAYDTPVSDTVGKAASHPVISLGGQVTSYSLLVLPGNEESLPAGLSLNPVTGLISGTPLEPPVVIWFKRSAEGYSSQSATYYILATGPAGKDTAAITLGIVWYGEVPEPPQPPVPEAAQLNLAVSLGASPGFALSRMVVTLTSSVASDAVIRDTIRPGVAGFTAGAGSQIVAKSYSVKPLRHWTAAVKTLDARDSAIHLGQEIASNVFAGEVRTVDLSLAARYEPYVARFALPDSLIFSGAASKRAISFKRLQVTVDGRTVRDSTRVSDFFSPLPAMHALQYDYVRSGTHAWVISVYGDFEGSDPALPLFSGSVNLSSNIFSMNLAWVGPGNRPTNPVLVTIEKRNFIIVADPWPPVVLP